MDQPPATPDPSARTQPIPVVPVAPPRTVVAPLAPAPYVHRFGNIPWYLVARLAAFAIDYLGVAFVAATFGFHVAERGFILFAGRDAAGFATLTAASFGFAIVLAFVCEAVFGTTLGKLVFALHVRRRDGRHAGGGRAFVRALLRPIDVLIVGPLLALVTPRHQRLGDVVAGTVVAGSRLGAFASLVGLVLVAAIAYAQVTFGGGVTSAIGVTAETVEYAPSLYSRVAAALGLAAWHGSTLLPATGPAPQPSTATPQPEATDEATPAPSGTSNV